VREQPSKEVTRIQANTHTKTLNGGVFNVKSSQEGGKRKRKVVSSGWKDDFLNKYTRRRREKKTITEEIC